jgi:hypothetical protein
MRLLLVLLVGLLAFAFTACPAPEETDEDVTAIDDEGMRKPDYDQEEPAVEEGDEMVTEEPAEAVEVCEICGKSPCECEVAEGEEEPPAEDEAEGGAEEPGDDAEDEAEEEEAEPTENEG